MATATDITVTPVTGLTHIDALLDKGPDWNYLTLNGNPPGPVAPVETRVSAATTGLGD